MRATVPTPLPSPQLAPAVPARREPAARGFGSGYGRSSGYAGHRGYSSERALSPFRFS